LDADWPQCLQYFRSNLLIDARSSKGDAGAYQLMTSVSAAPVAWERSMLLAVAIRHLQRPATPGTAQEPSQQGWSTSCRTLKLSHACVPSCVGANLLLVAHVLVPRQTFDPSKLEELAGSIRQHGLIQRVTVRPKANGFEIVAGARRFRASQLAELFSVPARIVDLDDTAAMEWQLVENSQRLA
jgi:hypothetical protein